MKAKIITFLKQLRSALVTHPIISAFVTSVIFVGISVLMIMSGSDLLIFLALPAIFPGYLAEIITSGNVHGGPEGFWSYFTGITVAIAFWMILSYSFIKWFWKRRPSIYR